MSSNDAPFRPLPHDEFVKLSLDEKIAYLARATEAFSGSRKPGRTAPTAARPRATEKLL
jgi:hypothetical protein